MPRLLVHVNRLSLTVRRTLAVQRAFGLEHFATTLQPVSVCFLFENVQTVSPAQAPSVLMTAGSAPSRKSRAEQVPHWVPRRRQSSRSLRGRHSYYLDDERRPD